MSPTQRTLAWLREQGYRCQVVERWCPHSRRRVDLFGCIDVLAIHGAITMGVQACSAGDVSKRVAKVLSLPDARAWVGGGGRSLLVIGWRKYKKAEDGKFWRPVVRFIAPEDFITPVDREAA